MPSFRHVPRSTWLALGVSLLFAAGGAALALEPATRRGGLLAGGFFALCALVFVLDILDLLPRQRLFAAWPQTSRRSRPPGAATLRRLAALDRALTPDELARRRPVWSALSDLFLDTELQPGDHARIARVLRDSGYPDATLRRILLREVAPVVSANLLSVAGEWAGFPEDWLAERIRERLASQPVARWLGERMPWFALAATRKDRAAIQAALARLRQDPALLAAHLAERGAAPAAREHAARELAFLAGDARPHARAIRAAVVDDPAPPVRAAAVAALWRAEWLDALDAVVRALVDPAPSVRRAAAEVLANASHHERLGSPPAPELPPGAVDAAAALLRDRSPEVRKAGAGTLGVLAFLGEGPAATNALLAALDEPDAAVRGTLARALARTSPGEARLAPALAALRGSAVDARRTAVLTLMLVARGAAEGNAWLLEPLGAAVRDPDATARRFAIQALGYLGRLAERELPLVAAAVSDPDPEVRGEALQALARLETALGRPPLERLAEALEGDDPALSRAAFHALSSLGDAAAPLAARLERLARRRDPVRSSSATVLLEYLRQRRTAR